MKILVKTVKMLAIITLSALMLVSCKKPDTHEEPPVLDELDNAIEYMDVITDIRSTFVDAETEEVYLVAQENITSVDQLSEGNCEYVRISMTGDIEVDGMFYALDLMTAPLDYEIEYVKDGATVLSVTNVDHSAITMGTFEMRVDPDLVVMEIDFSMALVEGGYFRGNADVSMDVIDEPSGPSYPENDMTFMLNGLESPVGSAVAEVYDQYIMFTLSPETGYESFNDIYEAGADYIQVLLLPEYFNRDLDVLTESVVIYGWRGMDETYLQIHADAGRELLESGYVRVDEVGEDTYSVCMSLSFVNLNEVGARATATLAEPAPEETNTITVNGNTEPVRAAFYMDYDDTYVYLYFTSAAIEYFGEIDSAFDYFGLALEVDDLTGNPIDITTTDKYFYLFYMDNLTGNMPVTMTGDLQGATGSVSVSRSASDPEQFTADITVTFGDGTEVIVDFEGSALSVDYAPEEPNEYTYDGMTEAIQSVLVDKTGGDIWEIWVSAVGGMELPEEFEADGAIHITAPAEAFNAGYGVGFSTYPDILKFEFMGETWQYPDMGTLTVDLNGTDIVLDFTTYGNLEGHYSGTAVVIE